MTHPTTLSPWFVVARELMLEDRGLEFYTTLEEDLTRAPKFSQRKRDAMLFLNLNSAMRQRDSDPGSFIITLCSRADMEDYGR
jgi:hypothetical protein